jgi:hypothetical protein
MKDGQSMLIGELKLTIFLERRMEKCLAAVRKIEEGDRIVFA